MPHHLEQMQLLTVGCMVPDRLVATTVLHISSLALAEVMIGAIRTLPVRVAVWLAGLARKQENYGLLSRRAYATTLLAAIRLVQPSPLVSLILLEHGRPMSRCAHLR